jgi:hypothetical protein
MVKKFNYHGTPRECAVTKTDSSYIEGVEISYIDSEATKTEFRKLYASLNVGDNISSDQLETLRPYFKYFRRYKRAEMN